MYSIGEILTKHRKEKGLSQADLASMLQKEGFTQTSKAISKWEKNVAEPSVTIFMTLCRLLDITDIYEEYFGINPNNILSSLDDTGKEKVMDYVALLHASNLYEKHVCEIIPFTRKIDVYENAVSAGTGNFLVDSPKESVEVASDSIPENATFGVKISGDSMEPEFSNGQIAWVLKQESLENGEIGIFSLNGDAYIKKLQDDADGLFLISLNTNYAPIKVGENDRFDIFGKVVGKSDLTEIPGYSHL